MIYSRYTSFSLDAAPPPDVTVRQIYRLVRVLPNGVKLVAPSQQIVVEQPDEVFIYCNTLCHWALQVMNMSDMVAEGDLSRIMPNLLANIPLFFSHSHLSKYFVECMDYIMKVRCCSPQMASRLLEGSFVNPKGGAGKGCEGDLRVEHSVKERKKLIEMLGANKSETAIKRVTGAADGLSELMEKMDYGLQLKEDSGHHSAPFSEEQERFIADTLRNLRPFDKQPGRKCLGFPGIKFVYDKVNREHITSLLQRNIERILAGLEIEVDDESDEDE